MEIGFFQPQVRMPTGTELGGFMGQMNQEGVIRAQVAMENLGEEMR